jgi:hypothetical protein
VLRIHDIWCGSGSGFADPCLWLMHLDSDSDPDPAIFVIDVQDALAKTNLKKFSCLLLFEGIQYLHQFSKIKSQKRSQNSRNQGFSYYFSWWSGSIPLTNGSGSGTGGPKTYGSDGSGSATLPNCLDPDPQHCWMLFISPRPVLEGGVIYRSKSSSKPKYQ